MKYLFSAALLAALLSISGVALSEDELDFSFLQGGARIDAKKWELLNSQYIPGQYLVDVSLNKNRLTKTILNIGTDESSKLCFTKEWLHKIEISISDEFYKSVWKNGRQCYELESQPDTSINFDFSTQKIEITVPQKGLENKKSKSKQWDYGTNALRLNYNVNANTVADDIDFYSSAGITANIGKWVVNSSAHLSNEKFNFGSFTATRAIKSLQADLSIGKTSFGGSVGGSASLLGAKLSNNNSMTPSKVGYRPVFSGITQTFARVTLTQDNNVIYSEILPPGPFELNNVSLLNNGDVTMKITESTGEVSTQFYPLTIAPNLLSPGESDYEMAIGVRDTGSSENQLSSLFYAGHISYGFTHSTVRTSLLLHPDYANAGFGIVKTLGEWGTGSLESNHSYAKYNNGDALASNKLSLAYNNNITDSTHFSLFANRYLTEKYIDFSNFNPDHQLSEATVSPIKEELQLNIRQQLSRDTKMSVSAWQRSYFNADDRSGVNLSLSTRFDDISLSLGGNYSKNGQLSAYNIGLSVSVPFDVFDKGYHTSTSFNQTDTSSSVSAGLSSTINDSLSYSLSSNKNLDTNSQRHSLSARFHGDRVLANVSATQAAGDISATASVSGSLIALPHQQDVIFTRSTNDTIAIVNTGNVEGVKFRSSPYPTNNNGNAVVPLNSYYNNRIALDGSTLPIDTELVVSSTNVVPVANSVVYVPFETVQLKRYLLQIKTAQGQFIPTGTWATTMDDRPLGFVSQNGVLFISSINKPESIVLDGCLISANNIKDTTKLQEVTCEI